MFESLSLRPKPQASTAARGETLATPASPTIPVRQNKPTYNSSRKRPKNRPARKSSDPKARNRFQQDLRMLKNSCQKWIRAELDKGSISGNAARQLRETLNSLIGEGRGREKLTGEARRAFVAMDETCMAHLKAKGFKKTEAAMLETVRELREKVLGEAMEGMNLGLGQSGQCEKPEEQKYGGPEVPGDQVVERADEEIEGMGVGVTKGVEEEIDMEGGPE